VEASIATREAELDGNIFRRTRTRNWEVDRITEKITTPRGEIARVSAAVLIDGNYEDKGGVRVYQPRDPEELKRLEEVVKNAIGFSAERGDSIRVEGAKFSRLDATPEEPIGFQAERYLPYALGALGLLTLLGMLLVFMRAVKTHSLPPTRAQLSAGAATTLETGAQPAVMFAGATPALPAASPAELEERRALAIAMASKDPSGAALILSRWLSTGDELPVNASADR
jgi:flagellar M-ring protein FliF